MDEQPFQFNFNLGNSLYNKQRSTQLNSVLPFGNNMESSIGDYNLNPDTTELDKQMAKFNESIDNQKYTMPDYKETFVDELAKNPVGGMSLDTSLFKLGETFAFDSSTIGNEDYKKQAKAGNTTKMVGAALKSLFSMSRSVGSGMGMAKRDQYLRESYDKKMRYQLEHANTTYMKDGGSILEFLKNGGVITDEDVMVGEHITGLNEKNEHLANAELEDQEYILNNDNTIQKVIGKKHKYGGEKLQLEEGTKVVSDNLKIGKYMASKLKDEFSMDVKSNYTFAKVIDLYTKKSGLEKLNDEQKVLFKKLKDVEDTNDVSTNNINQQFLSGKIKEIEDSKKLIEEGRVKLFNTMFKEQEKSKSDLPKMEYGGVFKSREFKNIALKYGVNEDDAIKMFKEHMGNSTPKFPDGGKFKKSNKFYVEDYKKQHRNESDPRIFDNFDLNDRFSEYKKLFPELVDKYFAKNDNDFYVPTSGNDKWGESTLNFQKDYNSYVDDTSNYFKSLGYNPDELKSYSDSIRFLDNGDTRRLKDGKLGQVTTSRSGFYREVIDPKKLEMLNSKGIYTAKDVINNKDELGDILSDSEFNNITKGLDKFVNADYTIGAITNSDNGSNKVDTPVNTKNSNMKDLDINKGNNDNLNYLFMPDQSTPPPQGVTPHLKIDRRFDRLEAVKLTPEEQLKEIFRSENLALNKISQLPQSQNLAALSNLTANSQEASNKAIGQVQSINVQNQANVDRVNIGQSNLEENYRATDALDYERRQLTAVAKTQADLDNYFEFNRKIRLGEFNDRRKFDLLNNLYENYNISGNGGIDFDYSKKVEFYSKYMPKSEAIKKAKEETSQKNNK